MSTGYPPFGGGLTANELADNMINSRTNVARGGPIPMSTGYSPYSSSPPRGRSPVTSPYGSVPASSPASMGSPYGSVPVSSPASMGSPYASVPMSSPVSPYASTPMSSPRMITSPYASVPSQPPFAQTESMSLSRYGTRRSPVPSAPSVYHLSCPTMQSAITDGQRSLDFDPEYNTRPTIASLASSFPILASLLQVAGLMSVFDSPGHFTVFAPTDTAFQNLIASSPGTNLQGLKANKKLLTRILQNHVLGTVLTPDQLRCHPDWRMKTLSGDSFAIKTTTSQIRLVWNSGQTGTERTAHVSVPAVKASNGVIYPIDMVIV